MAILNPRDVDIQRRTVQLWLTEYRAETRKDKPGTGSVEDWIRAKVAEGPHAEDVVTTPDGEVPVAEIILQDLHNYA